MLANSTVRDLILGAVGVLRSLVSVLFTVAIMVFLWGLTKFLLNSGNPTEVENGRKYMLGGIIALFVLFSLVAIISFIQIQFFGFSFTQIFDVLLPD